MDKNGASKHIGILKMRIKGKKRNSLTFNKHKVDKMFSPFKRNQKISLYLLVGWKEMSASLLNDKY